MVRRCIICKKYWDRGCGRSFHKFPSDLKKRLSWCRELHLDARFVKQYNVVCSDHFSSKDFQIKPSGIRYLRPHAVPVKPESLRDEITTIYDTPPTCNEGSLELIAENPPTAEAVRIKGEQIPMHVISNVLDTIFQPEENTKHVEYCNTNSIIIVSEDAGDGSIKTEPEEYILPHSIDDSIRYAPMEILQSKPRHIPEITKPDQIKCRTCGNVCQNFFCVKVLITSYENKAIKELLIRCVPQLAKTLSDEDVICNPCLDTTILCAKFIETCLRVDEELHIPLQDIVEIEVCDNVTSVDYEDQDTATPSYVFTPFKHVPLDHNYQKPIPTESSSNVPVENSAVAGPSGEKSSSPEQTPSVLRRMKKRYKCAKCNKLFWTFRSLCRHVRTIHGNTHVTTMHAVERDMLNDLTLETSVITVEPADDLVRANNQSDKKVKKTYKCASCSKLFSTFGTLRRHVRTLHCVTKKPRYKCDYCEETFRRKCDYRPHLRNIHPERMLRAIYPTQEVKDSSNDFNLLDTCGIAIPSLEGYLLPIDNDVEVEKNEKMFTCARCSKLFTTFSSLRRHVRTIHNVIRKSRYTCDHCEETFMTKRSYRTHLRLSHPEKHRISNTCKQCGFKFLEKSDFIKHNAMHKVECHICSERFSSKEEVEEHIKMHPDKYFCDTCGRGFKQWSLLNTHREIHNAPNSHICEKCGKGFKRLRNLRCHLTNHFPDKKFMCEKCSKMFVDKNTLITHIRLRHTKIKPYQCELCGLRFGRADYLRRHLKTLYHNGKVRSEDVGRRVKISNNLKYQVEGPTGCTICGKIFKTRYGLKLHRKVTHANLHKCSFCNMTFAAERNRNKHEQLHNAPINKYRCRVCWKRMETKEALNEHMQIHKKRKRINECKFCKEVFKRKHLLDNHLVVMHKDEGDIDYEDVYEEAEVEIDFRDVEEYVAE